MTYSECSPAGEMHYANLPRMVPCKRAYRLPKLMASDHGDMFYVPNIDWCINPTIVHAHQSGSCENCIRQAREEQQQLSQEQTE